MYIVEMITRSGKVCERFRSYAQARRCILRVKDEDLLSVPLIFQELADGSQRLVREDGKPLQWHRLPEEDVVVEDPLPLAEPPQSADGGDVK